MTEQPTISDPEFQKAFIAHERQERISTGKVASLLVVFLMPLGSMMDWLVYHAQRWEFFWVRLLCSVLAFGLWYLHTTDFGLRHYRRLGVPIALLPAFFLCWIIATAQGALSGAAAHYYAALNLILLAVSVVVRWDVWESLTCVVAVILMYIAACSYRWLQPDPKTFFTDIANNLYFLSLTGIIVVTGNYLFNKLRLREFTLRYELDKNRKNLEEANLKLVELDRLKGRFFANISHELRTPLTLLLAPLETLMQRFERELDDGTRETLASMHGNGMRLLKLINDLLELIRIESGRADIKHDALVVADFVKGIASAVRQVAENKQVRLETSVDEQLGTVVVDRDKLEKIVLNLLFNAVKFTPAGGAVRLHAKKQGDEFILAVSDTGVGIAKKSLPFVFDRFWQADNSSKRKSAGVGIGLALVKELTEMQNGKVSVDSDEGKGAVFTVKLPYQKAEMQARPEATATTPAKDGAGTSDEWIAGLYRRAELFPTVAVARGNTKAPDLGGRRPVVLVAEDEPDMQRYLKTELQKDYDLVQAWDGAEALEKVQHYLPDIVLLDMMMPEIDGLEVCREMRKLETAKNTPVILLTARADEETKYDALKIGANDFLTKPFSSTELQARIKNLIEAHYNQRQISKQNVALTSAIEQIKETEIQLVQSEKLASLGRLSAGIIHEINNPLNYTLTGLFALRNKGKFLAPDQRGEYDEILNDVEEGIKRVHNIVTDLRTFTHPGGGIADTVEVADVVDASLRFLAGEWKDKIRIDQNLPPKQVVWANRNKLIQVFVNLMQNSMDALADKKFDAGQKPTICIEGRVADDRSLVIIRDNGTGIDPKLVDKIFDPFFTTKEVGKGMGLGLSICYRIVQGYGGKISVRSEPGKGCEFTIDLPLKQTAVAELEAQHG
jgi:signal transduction histidine kinase